MANLIKSIIGQNTSFDENFNNANIPEPVSNPIIGRAPSTILDSNVVLPGMKLAVKGDDGNASDYTVAVNTPEAKPVMDIRRVLSVGTLQEVDPEAKYTKAMGQLGNISKDFSTIKNTAGEVVSALEALGVDSAKAREVLGVTGDLVGTLDEFAYDIGTTNWLTLAKTAFYRFKLRRYISSGSRVPAFTDTEFDKEFADTVARIIKYYKLGRAGQQEAVPVFSAEGNEFSEILSNYIKANYQNTGDEEDLPYNHRDSISSKDFMVRDDVFWDINIEKPKGSGLPDLPFTVWTPLTSFTLDDSEIINNFNVSLPLGNTLNLPSNRSMPTTLSITLYETFDMKIEEWIRAINSAIVAKRTNGGYTILPYKKSHYNITIYWLNPQRWVINKKTYAVIPTINRNFSGTTESTLRSYNMIFNIIGVEDYESIDGSSSF